MNAIPWTYDARPGSGFSNVRLGIWLFLASEAMFFGSLFSAYVMLRSGAENWPDAGALLDLRLALVNTALLAGSASVLFTIKPAGPAFSPAIKLAVSSALAAGFLAVKAFEYWSKLEAGLHPSTNVLLACWFTLTGVHALHVVAGAGVNVWLGATAKRIAPAHARERLHATRLYWFFVDAVWIAILVGFYFV
jgi:cytochrome c oxidase subunit 3